MKKNIILLFLLLLAINVCAQKTQEVVYLHNGSIIKGEILEQVPDDHIKIKMADGSVMVYQMSEVEKITKEEAQNTVKTNGHRGLDFNIDAGYHLATKGGGGSVSAELGVGKRFTKNFYWGISSGVFIPTGGGDISIPIASDFKVYFPLNSSSLTPGGIIRAGYVFNTADDVTVGTGKYKTTVEIPDNIMIQIMPTLEIPLSKKVDFNVGLGYTHFFPTKGGGNSSGAFSIRTGFSFHKSPIRGPKKPKKPIRNSGVQITLEGGKMNFGGDEYDGYTGALVFTYKLNPNLSFGLGGGVDFVNSYVEDAYKSLLIRQDGNVYGGGSGSDIDVDFHAVKVFARGTYRLNDKRLSPFASCDAGMRIYSFDEFFYTEDALIDNPSSVAPFVSPAIGLSLRTTNNSYIELKAGYSFAKNVFGETKEGTYENGNYQFEYTASCKPMKMSAPFVTLGFTHTFKWGEKK